MVEMGKLSRVAIAAIALAVIAFGVLRVRSTLTVFSSTFDEPDHIANGMEWLSRGTYTYEPKHTPLGRVAAAFPLWLDGSRTVGLAGAWDEGNAIFASRARFKTDLAKARSGTIVFFVLMCGVVFCWSRELFGPWIGLLCLLEVSLLPAVLALSGLVTTDMAGASTFLLSLWMLLRWSRQRTVWRAVAAGLCIGLALLAKLSAVPFLLGCAMAWLALQCWMRRGWPPEAIRFRLGQILLIGLSAFLLIWAGYRFQSEPLSRANTVRLYQTRLDQHTVSGRLISKALDVPIPGGNMIRGFGDLLLMERGPTILQYFRGEVKRGGWHLYFPVAFAVKAPLPFLILSGIMLLLAVRVAIRRGEIEWCYPAAFAAVVFLVCFPTHWNIGTRYLLALYPLCSIGSGLAIKTMWQSRRFTLASRAVPIALMLWLGAESVSAHPDYLAYFNELAGSHPEKILVEGDLDWGQDLYRLQQEAERVHARPLWEFYYGSTSPQAYGLDARRLPDDGTVAGWVAVSMRHLLFSPERFAWLAPYSWRPVGKSIRLYYVPEPAPAPSALPSREQALTMLHLR
jgi:hypothetical protein